MKQKNRTVGLLGAVSIGIGGMVGGGIFAVLGEAVALARGATAVAFILAGVVALLTSYSYAKLSVKYQNRGGTVVFIDNAFSHNLLSGSMNLTEYSSTTSTDFTKSVTSQEGSPSKAITLSIDHFTAAALNAVPSVNFRPSLSLKVYSSPLALTV